MHQSQTLQQLFATQRREDWLGELKALEARWDLAIEVYDDESKMPLYEGSAAKTRLTLARTADGTAKGEFTAVTQRKDEWLDRCEGCPSPA